VTNPELAQPDGASELDPRPSDHTDVGVGLRQGEERRHANRRSQARSRERRHGDRRRRAAGGLLLGMVALGGGLGQAARRAPAPPQYTQTHTARAPQTTVEPVEQDRRYDDIIQEAAEAYDVDPELIRAVIRTESSFDPQAISPAGAQGLMQLMPFLSKELGVKDPLDPRENIFGGVKYLSKLLNRHDGNVSLAVASYNAGPTAVKRYKGIPPYKETRGYVKKITGLLADAQVADASLSTVTSLGD
jgi:hypothetical protein